jgi:hypothetical protein
MRMLPTLAIVLIGTLVTGCKSFDASAVGDFFGDGALTNDTIVQGLKEALQNGTDRSVAQLSKAGGYADDAALRIVLPEKLQKFASTLRKVGLSGELDAFEDKMNAAAEHAVTQAGPVFLDAITSMSFDDARKILSGKKTAATQFFKRKTKKRLAALYQPTVQSHMSQVGAVQSYNDLRASYDKIPFAPKLEFSLEDYVTDQALDGLFLALGAVEKDIRTNPAARVTDLLQRVFAQQ